MRRPLICGNWKMHKTVSDAARLAKDIAAELGRAGLTGTAAPEVSVAPPFSALAAVAATLAGSAVKLAGQNCFWETQGAFTGEVSAAMLRDLGCSQVILGHSERRQFFGETDEAVGRKIKASLEAGLTPIVCVGETLAEREQNRTGAIIEGQLAGALAGHAAEVLQQLVIAYEPVWAIGTGKTATPAQAEEVHALIRSWLEGRAKGVSEEVRILYGGSVKPDNAKSLLSEKNIDGALVGGASLEAKSFVAIVRSAS